MNVDLLFHAPQMHETFSGPLNLHWLIFFLKHHATTIQAYVSFNFLTIIKTIKAFLLYF